MNFHEFKLYITIYLNFCFFLREFEGTHVPYSLSLGAISKTSGNSMVNWLGDSVAWLIYVYMSFTVRFLDKLFVYLNVMITFT